MLSYRTTNSVTNINMVIFVINVIIQGLSASQTLAVITKTTYIANITDRLLAQTVKILVKVKVKKADVGGHVV